jgi:tetratricopeptide (TPR) repeat protein
MDFQSRVQEAFRGLYALERELGRGGSSVVFLASDLKHPRKVALKVLRPDVTPTIAPERFRQEIEIEASMAHPNILPLHDSGEVGGLLFYVTPALEGQSLADTLAARGPLPVGLAVRIASEVAGALAYAHRRGVVHRDIKPGNILLSDDHALVADFGIARILGDGGLSTTSASTVLGTLLYVSPEQVGTGDAIDGRTDIYALGCVLFEMLTGTPLFQARTPEAVLARHLHGDVSESLRRETRIPPAVAEVIERCVARKAKDRFPNPEAFAAALAGATRPDRAPPQRSWAPLVAAVVAVAALLAGWAWTLRSDPALALDARRSYLVQAHRVSSMSPQEEELAVEAAGVLTRFLSGWREITAVPEVSQASVGFSVGLAGSVRTSLAESFRMAEAYPVGTLITVTVDITNDSATMEAVRFDVATRDQLGDALRSTGATADLQGLVIPIALEVLELAGAPPTLILQRESSVIAALQDLRTGQRLLEQWDLPGARARFREALAADSTLGRAHYYLALTDYWEVARDWTTADRLEPRIVTEAVAAARHSGRMTYRDSIHADAFASLAVGQFEAARSRYESLVRSDSTDSYAWLLLGGTEHTDPVTLEAPAGGVTPRGNPNRAARAFQEAVRLAPDFALGFGYLFDQYRSLATDPEECEYRAFRPPGAPDLPMADTDPSDRVYRCFVALDSLGWLSSDDLRSVDLATAGRGAEGHRLQALALLERWRQFSPASSRALEELTLWRIEERRRLPPLRWSDADSLGAAALSLWSEALALRTDTTAGDLNRLANLHLAAGRTSEAVVVARRALALARSSGLGPADLSPSIANPFLAAGRVSEALPLVATVHAGFASDVAPGRTLPWGVEAEIQGISALAAVGLTDGRVSRFLEAIPAAWTRMGYGDADQKALRRALLPLVGLALTGDRARAAAWLGDGATPDGLWSALLALDPADAGPWIESRRPLPSPEVLPRVQRYLVGLALIRAGKPAEASDYFRAVRLEPPSVDWFDESWGLQVSAALHEARASEETAASRTAVTAYTFATDRWWDPDPELAPRIAAARDAIARLEVR